MCMGRRKRKAAKAAAAEQARLNQLAADRQAEIDAQNQVMELEIKKQEEQVKTFQSSQEAITAENQVAQQNFDAIRALQETQFAEEQARIRQQNLVNQSVNQSLQVLSTKKKKKGQAPQAGQDFKKDGISNQARYNSPTKDLRVGSLKRECGVGVNLGG